MKHFDPAGMANSHHIDTGMRQNRTVVLLGLIGITLLAWTYTVHLAGNMGGMNMAMPRTQDWGALELVLLFVMWAFMMVAMMVPSASPMVLMYTVTLQRREQRQGGLVQPGLFVLGYLAIWTGFSLLATLAQWGLHAAALLSPMAVSTNPMLDGVLLTAAGAFQWSPLKHACLRRCRSPLGFLMTEWREGPGGAFIMGFRHGVFCVGCCWALMALLFVTGVMNLLWISAIAGFILVEKVIPAGEYVARLAGLLLIGLGISMVADSINA
jgi:predicted metal-binding membrane protein